MDLLTEALGVLSNIQVADMEYNRILVGGQLLQPFIKYFQVNRHKNECIIMALLLAFELCTCR